MKRRTISGVELKRVRRCDVWGYPQMHGGYVAYPDYCINVSRLKDRIEELENRIFNLKRLGKTLLSAKRK